MIITITEFWFCMVVLASLICGALSYALASAIAEADFNALVRWAESLESDRDDKKDEAECQCNAMKNEKPFNE